MELQGTTKSTDLIKTKPHFVPGRVRTRRIYSKRWKSLTVKPGFSNWERIWQWDPRAHVTRYNLSIING